MDEGWFERSRAVSAFQQQMKAGLRRGPAAGLQVGSWLSQKISLSSTCMKAGLRRSRAVSKFLLNSDEGWFEAVPGCLKISSQQRRRLEFSHMEGDDRNSYCPSSEDKSTQKRKREEEDEELDVPRINEEPEEKKRRSNEIMKDISVDTIHYSYSSGALFKISNCKFCKVVINDSFRMEFTSESREYFGDLSISSFLHHEKEAQILEQKLKQEAQKRKQQAQERKLEAQMREQQLKQEAQKRKQEAQKRKQEAQKRKEQLQMEAQERKLDAQIRKEQLKQETQKRQQDFSLGKVCTGLKISNMTFPNFFINDSFQMMCSDDANQSSSFTLLMNQSGDSFQSDEDEWSQDESDDEDEWSQDESDDEDEWSQDESDDEDEWSQDEYDDEDEWSQDESDDDNEYQSDEYFGNEY
ncbi:hypothetical protein AVEN_5374-1 [Araneus ventricosus]|uniref:Uncharacterized protein n=1 Tax=Araneus ventricosus TaxID=182803 RepID=A0A4Y2SBG6_ARAVE|nr:hypothetical protein AVEN_5374-1 [Araneus ventricosus]